MQVWPAGISKYYVVKPAHVQEWMHERAHSHRCIVIIVVGIIVSSSTHCSHSRCVSSHYVVVLSSARDSAREVREGTRDVSMRDGASHRAREMARQHKRRHKR